MKLLKSKSFIFSFLVFMLLGMGIYYISFGFPWDYLEYKDKFESYVEEKYQKDFVIDEISYDAIHDTYHSYAHEKGRPKMEFYIGQNMRDKKITDAYEFEKTMMKAQTDISSIMEKTLPGFKKSAVELISLSNKELEINVWMNKEVDDEIKELVKTKIENKGYTTNQLYFNFED